ncbi:MAG: hypothetical protein U9P81_09665 [Euryarchaeota archaeon]|nr:hypothetical protein [Euryarchaeota archaeon]
MNNPYMVFIGDSIISGNVAHHSDETISISIDTSTLGTWNYTIIVNDTSGYITIDSTEVRISFFIFK